MELSQQEIKLLLTVVSQCSYNFENAKLVTSLSERLSKMYIGKEAEINKTDKVNG